MLLLVACYSELFDELRHTAFAGYQAHNVSHNPSHAAVLGLAATLAAVREHCKTFLVVATLMRSPHLLTVWRSSVLSMRAEPRRGGMRAHTICHVRLVYAARRFQRCCLTGWQLPCMKLRSYVILQLAKSATGGCCL